MGFARLISYLFHPVVMPLFGLIIVLNSSIYISSSLSGGIQLVTLFTVFLFTCMLPLLNVHYLARKGVVKSIYLESREERRIPYGVMIAYYIILYYFLEELRLPRVLYSIIIGSALATALAFIINFKWKISAHMIGIGGVIGVVIGLSERLSLNLNGILILLFLLAGIIGFSRLQLKAHEPFQVYLGFFVGLGSLLMAILAA